MTKIITAKSLISEIQKYNYRNLVFVDYKKQVILVATYKFPTQINQDTIVRLERAPIEYRTRLKSFTSCSIGPLTAHYTIKELTFNINYRGWSLSALNIDGFQPIFSAYNRRPLVFTEQDHKAIEHIESNFFLYQHFI